MYDQLDDIEDITDAPINEQRARRVWVIWGLCAAIVILAGAALITSQRAQTPVLDFDAIKAEQAAYKAAITAPSPAVRRARLTDFITTYEDSDRKNAAAAQLRVLSEAEAKDWADLTHKIFDVDQSTNAKLLALETYETLWDTALLGGRAQAAMRIRKILSAETGALPSRDLPIDPDDIPDADNLAGGAGSTKGVTYRPPDNPFGDAYVQIDDVIKAPKLRRNVRPHYPRRAQNAGAEALIVLRLFVDERGRVEGTQLVTAEADRYERDFIKAAERAALRMRYRPKTINGQPVPDHEGFTKRFRFQIEN